VVRSLLAPNASPLTLDGTRTYIVGETRPVIIDPGPADPAHLDAIVDALGDGVPVAVLLTHAHPDHLAGAGPLAERLDSPVRRLGNGSLRDGAVVETDAGRVIAVATPGHTTDHLAFHWPEGSAVFCGDLMMGGHDTALVAPPEGRLGPYLMSLERVRALRPAVIHPAHGPDFDDPDAAIDRYVRHREARLKQVLGAVEAGGRDYDTLRRQVYGDTLDPGLERAATAALKAYLEHLQGLGRVRRLGRGWVATG
jgi:glyoxylase-like metal-dependent hydrolase (beta-lactamase superfamily II)